MAGHIRKRKDKNGRAMDGWQARYPDPTRPGKRFERWFRTKDEASAWLTLQQAAVLKGEHHDPRRAARPFSEVVDAWRESWPGRLEPRTVAGYESTLKTYLTPEFGTKKVGSITHETVQRYVNRLGTTAISPATVRGVYAVLRTVMGYGVRMGMVRANPCSNIDLPRAPKEEMLFLTADEVAAVAEAIDPRYRALVYTAAYTGLRAGELGGLQRQDVDPLRGVLHVRRSLKDVNGKLSFGPTKTHQRRTVSLPGFLREMLATHLTPAPGGTAAPDDLVFTGPNGGPLRQGLFYNRYFKVAVRGRPAKGKRPAIPAALPPHLHGLRFHDLRHTCAALSIAAGAHPKLISARLGHSSITITLDRYGHLFPSVEEALADALDAAFAAPDTPAVSVATKVPG